MIALSVNAHTHAQRGRRLYVNWVLVLNTPHALAAIAASAEACACASFASASTAAASCAFCSFSASSACFSNLFDDISASAAAVAAPLCAASSSSACLVRVSSAARSAASRSASFFAVLSVGSNARHVGECQKTPFTSINKGLQCEGSGVLWPLWGGHLGVLKWAVQHDCPWYEGTGGKNIALIPTARRPPHPPLPGPQTEQPPRAVSPAPEPLS